MPTDFVLPELGENVTAGDVVRILVGPGDTLEKEQAVLELETDKATIEVPSSVSGTVKEIKVKQGDRIKVGQVVLIVDEAAAAPGNSAAPAAKSAGDAKPKRQPEGAVEEGGLSQQTPETRDNASRSAADSGQRGEQQRDAGRAQPPETQQADPDASKPKRAEVVDISRGARPAAAAPAPGPADAGADQGPAPAAAPSVRRLARELGVDIRRVTGSSFRGWSSGHCS